MLLKDNIEVHDKYQFEIKLGYMLPHEKQNTFYNIETYLFIPNNLGINNHTYKRDDFYNDIHSYIRFKTPDIPLKNIVDNQESPYKKLKKTITKLSTNIDKKTSFLMKDNLMLNGIIYSPDSPIAIINDNIRGVGDRIKNFKVVQITQSKVVLEDSSGNQFTLTVK